MKNQSITQLAALALGVGLLLGAVYLGLGAGPAAADTPPVASRTPDSIDFGSQQAGTTSAPRTITVTAVSDGWEQVCDPRLKPPCEIYDDPTTISNLTIGGTDAAAFSVSSQNCTGRYLWQGETCSIDVTFSPAAVGSYSATLNINSNSSWSTGNQVQLSGNCSQDENGKIAYQTYDGNDSEIYTIDPCGGTPFNVTNNHRLDVAPSYSPFGTKIAYQGRDGHDFEIFTVNATGGTPFNVTNNTTEDGGYDDSTSYSPDGTKIAYQAYDGNDMEIYTINASGGTPFNVTNNTTNDYRPSYSPDGQKIAYEGFHTGDDEIYTINASGGTPFQVTNGATIEGQPSYSPLGTKIAYQGFDGQDDEIFTVNATGGTPFQVTNNTTYDGAPSYSPDGTRIAYEGFDVADSDIYTISATGGTPFKVTNNPEHDSNPSWGIDPPPDTQAPRVSRTSPTANATEVAPSANLTATFSETMDRTSVTTSTFKLFEVTSTGTTQITNVSVSSDGLKATLNPFGNSPTLLSGGTKYKAVVTSGAKDVAGNPLDQNTTKDGSQQKAWTFTVRN